jgi:hypothetical protein
VPIFIGRGAPSKINHLRQNIEAAASQKIAAGKRLGSCDERWRCLSVRRR